MISAEITEGSSALQIAKHDAIPEAPTDGLVVQTKYCGICHSDLHAKNELTSASFKGMPEAYKSIKFPCVLGHEISGIVYSLGENIASGDLAIGDNVIVFPWVGCGDCRFCEAEEDNLCDKHSVEIGFGLDGGFSNYVVVNKRNWVIKLPKEIPLDVACMLPCSGLTTYNALTKIRPCISQALDFKGKASLLVIGAGGLGFWCLQTARSMFPTIKIYSADIDETKLEIAKSREADDTILWQNSENKQQIIQDSVCKAREKVTDGFDAIIDLVDTSTTSETAFRCLAKCGILVVVGLFGGQLSLPLLNVVRGMLTVRGCYVGSSKQLKELVAFVAKNQIKPPPMTFYSLEDLSSAFQKLEKGEIVGRGIVKY